MSLFYCRQRAGDRKEGKRPGGCPLYAILPPPWGEEEGERKEEKDEKPHLLLSYLISVLDAGRQPFNTPTILAKNPGFSYVFPTSPQ